MTAAFVWAISAATIGGILVRPWRSAEWQWAAAGAIVLVAAGLLPVSSAIYAVRDGMDVYLFLAGMLVLAELARAEGLFEALASAAVFKAAPFSSRLFVWTYAVGAAVTALLSNDGTIVLLTPAVLAAARKARVNVMPYAFSCALVANAASFILPIGNPANLVVFRTLPALVPWVRAFALPSLAAVLLTFIVLCVCFWQLLSKRYEPVDRLGESLPAHARACAVALAVSVVCIVSVSALGQPVGLWAFGCAVFSATIVLAFNRAAVLEAMRSTPWSIIVLVAALFVVVAALDSSGVLRTARAFLAFAAVLPAVAGNVISGTAAALACNVLNNLPTAVIARYSVQSAHLPDRVLRAVLIGVDLGPNLTPAGSLATILWLTLLRREGAAVPPQQFIKIGVAVTLTALFAALAAAAI